MTPEEKTQLPPGARLLRSRGKAVLVGFDVRSERHDRFVAARFLEMERLHRHGRERRRDLASSQVPERTDLPCLENRPALERATATARLSFKGGRSLNFATAHLFENFQRRLSLDWRPQREDRVKNSAERIDVRTFIDLRRATARLLG
jgi:hypothetical protein